MGDFWADAPEVLSMCGRRAEKTRLRGLPFYHVVKFPFRVTVCPREAAATAQPRVDWQIHWVQDSNVLEAGEVTVEGPLFDVRRAFEKAAFAVEKKTAEMVEDLLSHRYDKERVGPRVFG